MEPRIVFIARGIARESATSGSGRRVEAVLGELDRRDVPYLAYTAPPHAADRGPARRAWHRLPLVVRGARRDLSTYIGGIRWAKRVTDEVRAFAPDVVYERAEYLDPAGASLAAALGVPHVLELHGLLADNARSYYRSPFEPLGAFYERRRYRRAAATVVVSQPLAAWLRDHAPTVSSEVVPSGVEIPDDLETIAVDARSLRASWALGDRFVVGWIGHVMSWQAPLLAEILRRLAPVPDIAVVIVGDLSAADETRSAAAAAPYPVVLAGVHSGRAADVHVATFDAGLFVDTRSLGLPVKLFQYGALSVPVLSSDVESMRGFDEGRDLVAFFDVDDVADAVIRLRGDPETATRTARLHAAVMQSHTWPIVVDRLLDVCRRAACSARLPSRR